MELLSEIQYQMKLNIVMILYAQLGNGNPVLVSLGYAKTLSLTLDLQKQFDYHFFRNTKCGLVLV